MHIIKLPNYYLHKFTIIKVPQIQKHISETVLDSDTPVR